MIEEFRYRPRLNIRKMILHQRQKISTALQEFHVIWSIIRIITIKHYWKGYLSKGLFLVHQRNLKLAKIALSIIRGEKQGCQHELYREWWSCSFSYFRTTKQMTIMMIWFTKEMVYLCALLPFRAIRSLLTPTTLLSSKCFIPAKNR